MIETQDSKKKALLVIPIEDINDSKLRIDELSSLVKTMGLEVLSAIVFKIREFNSATMLGKGQLEELKDNIIYFECDCVIFDTSLSPRVLRNLENELDICVIDREEVILQIFADRAQTKEAKLQVALARSEYSLPRLRRRWEDLSQQRGGVRGSKGSGERQLELDKRSLSEKIVALKRELEEVKKIRKTQRKSREKKDAYSFALVGYTNAGKSSLLNLLTNANTLVEDKLFATLDPTTRQFKLKNRIDVTLTDTVGFVSNLPHHLISAFSSTLEEAKYADTLIIVIDLANPDCERCQETTLEVLTSLGAGDNDKIIVFNKIDNIANDIAYQRLKVSYPNHIEISVKERKNIDLLLDEMYKRVLETKKRSTIYLPPEDGKALSEIYRKYTVFSCTYENDKLKVEYLT